jgi:hypothetical protein
MPSMRAQLTGARTQSQPVGQVRARHREWVAHNVIKTTGPQVRVRVKTRGRKVKPLERVDTGTRRQLNHDKPRLRDRPLPDNDSIALPHDLEHRLGPLQLLGGPVGPHGCPNKAPAIREGGMKRFFPHLAIGIRTRR